MHELEKLERSRVSSKNYSSSGLERRNELSSGSRESSCSGGSSGLKARAACRLEQLGGSSVSLPALAPQIGFRIWIIQKIIKLLWQKKEREYNYAYSVKMYVKSNYCYNLFQFFSQFILLFILPAYGHFSKFYNFFYSWIFIQFLELFEFFKIFGKVRPRVQF